MENRESKSIQTALFDIIRQSLPANLTPASVVSEVLGLSMNTTYTRIRGEKPLSLEEAVLLCRRFDISLDALVNTGSLMQIPCGYLPMLGGDNATYLRLVRELVEKLRKIGTDGSEVSMLATVDIPLFHEFMYSEVSTFRYFSWSHLFANSTSYEEFAAHAANSEVDDIYSRIREYYLQIPSSEIWTVDTISTMLQFLTYHHQMGHFASAESALSICRKLTELMNTLEEWAATGTKGPGGAPFNLYISGIDIGTGFLLFKNFSRLSCWLKLFTLHGLVFTDETLCHEVENWLERSLQRATLISGASEMERYKFFDGQRQKINALARKIGGQSA